MPARVISEAVLLILWTLNTTGSEMVLSVEINLTRSFVVTIPTKVPCSAVIVLKPAGNTSAPLPLLPLIVNGVPNFLLVVNLRSALKV